MASTREDRGGDGVRRLIRGSNPGQHAASDLRLYREELEAFLPDEVIDAHVHLWTPACLAESISDDRYTSTMLEMVDGFSAAGMAHVYAELLPRKRVRGVVFGLAAYEADSARVNAYVAGETAAVEARLLIPPWSRTASEPRDHDGVLVELAALLAAGRFAGFKPYPEHARHRPLEDVVVDDFVSEPQWRLADERGLVIMLHLPRLRGVGDPSNLAILADRLQRFPNARVILAHLGVPGDRPDLATGLARLKAYPNLFLDTSMVTDADLVATAIDAVEPRRILFGTDLPFSLVRGHKERRGGRSRLMTQERYCFGVTAGRRCTYLLYASILAIKGAATQLGLEAPDIRAIFTDNARRILASRAA